MAITHLTDPAFNKEERLNATTLRVTRKSHWTGVLNTMDLPATAAQWAEYQRDVDFIHVALPLLTEEHLEFLSIGVLPGDHAKPWPPKRSN